jgi:hypothetical protein
MTEPLDWPTIKQRYPELAARLIAGDLEARVEFARLSFGAEVISVTTNHSRPRPIPPAKPKVKSKTPTATHSESLLELPEQSPNPPF